MRAELGSNDGESAIALDLQRRYTYATEPGFEGSVQICGRHWVDDDTHDSNVTIAGMWLRAEDLLELRSVLAKWLLDPCLNWMPNFFRASFNWRDCLVSRCAFASGQGLKSSKDDISS